MSNLIIVESENDKYFIESVIEYLNLNIEVDNPICKIDEFNCLGGYKKLSLKLQDIKIDDYDKIGIILDADNSINEKIDFINEALKVITDDVTITKTNQLQYSENLDIYFGCYITNIDGKGELETLLRKIKSQNSIYADCLESWRKCLEKNDIQLSQKEFDKLWVSHYLKYDTCIGRDRKQKAKKCANQLIQNPDNDKIEQNLKTTEYTLKKDIWDFESKYLNELKEFLKIFRKD